MQEKGLKYCPKHKTHTTGRIPKCRERVGPYLQEPLMIQGSRAHHEDLIGECFFRCQPPTRKISRENNNT